MEGRGNIESVNRGTRNDFASSLRTFEFLHLRTTHTKNEGVVHHIIVSCHTCMI